MNPDIITHPELASAYLVRKHRGGDPRSRYQPAIILGGRAPLSNEPSTGDSINDQLAMADHIKVRWLFTGEEETVLYFDGCVKALTKRWLRDELPQAETALLHAQLRFLAVKQLLSDPDIR